MEAAFSAVCLAKGFVTPSHLKVSQGLTFTPPHPFFDNLRNNSIISFIFENCMKAYSLIVHFLVYIYIYIYMLHRMSWFVGAFCTCKQRLDRLDYFCFSFYCLNFFSFLQAMSRAVFFLLRTDDNIF